MNGLLGLGIMMLGMLMEWLEIKFGIFDDLGNDLLRDVVVYVWGLRGRLE